MTQSPQIAKIINDIKSLKIQGATAVARAALDGINVFSEGFDKPVDIDEYMEALKVAGNDLVTARPNEPLARNGLRYILNTFKLEFESKTKTLDEAKLAVGILSDRYLKMISDSRERIVRYGKGHFLEVSQVLTHCHSSTVEKLIVAINSNSGETLKVIATETRPRYQGRITVRNLIEQGLDVTMIVDGAAVSVLAGNWEGYKPEAALIGCDRIMNDGSAINKIGSYAVALGAYRSSIPLYVVGSLLKLEPTTGDVLPEIELRNPEEVWEKAPEKLKILNPAFEFIPTELITGYITEFGVIDSDKVEQKFQEHYDWIW